MIKNAKIMTKNLLFPFALCFCLTQASAQMPDLSALNGYQIIYSGSITGYQDPGQKPHTDWEFEGCDFDRKIFIDDRYEVYCRGYSYAYSYHPQVTILSNGSSAKMIVNSQTFDISLHE